MKQFVAASIAAFVVLTVMWGAARLTNHYRAPAESPLIVEAVEHKVPSK